MTIRKPINAGAKSTKGGPRINEEIQADVVQLIGETGENLGHSSISEALERAKEAHLDLVELSPNAKPPVCKILDYGKYKYQEQKKSALSRKKQKTADLKEIKMRPNIDIHDYEVKMRNARRFIDDGDKVKFTLRFRGREMSHQQLGVDLFKRVREQTDAFAKVELSPRLEGRQMIMILAPR